MWADFDDKYIYKKTQQKGDSAPYTQYKCGSISILNILRLQ